tara:strand:- start:1236 stop:2258 length:1023 start_codon:yes stop_codon:yes gene_type:complete
METAHAHVRVIGNGAVVEATFDAVSAEPRIAAVATAQGNQFSVTPEMAKRAVTLSQHRAAWVNHARMAGDNDAGLKVMWLVTAQPGSNAVSMREISVVLSCAAQLNDMHVCILMDRASRDEFVQHWAGADDGSINWSQVHIFTTVLGLHAFVASRQDCIAHVCMVSGSATSVVPDMLVRNNTALHVVVHDGSFVYSVPQDRPMAMVHSDMPMLAAENGTASVQTRGSGNGNGNGSGSTTVEIRRLQGSSGPVRLLYVSKFCDNNGPPNPIQWLCNFVHDNQATERMQQDALLTSLVLRAAGVGAANRSSWGTAQPRLRQALRSVVSPHLHRSITQQNDMH